MSPTFLQVQMKKMAGNKFIIVFFKIADDRSGTRKCFAKG